MQGFVILNALRWLWAVCAVSWISWIVYGVWSSNPPHIAWVSLTALLLWLTSKKLDQWTAYAAILHNAREMKK